MTTTLYRVFDAQDRLLYVGICAGEFLRLAQHAESAPWAVYAVTITLERHLLRSVAEEEERRVIATEDPVWNVHGRPVRRYLQWMAAYPHRDPDDVDVESLRSRLGPGPQSGAGA